MTRCDQVRLLPSPESQKKAHLFLQKAEQDEIVLAKLRGDFDVGDEILGFHAQQAVEKRLKSVLAFHEIEFDRVHSIAYLAALLDRHGVDLPACRDQMEELTPWASSARYDNLLDGILDRDGIEGVALASREWAEKIVGAMSWFSAYANAFKHFARYTELDHLMLLVEGDDEGAVVHLTEDGSVWVSVLDQLAAFNLIGVVDLEGEPAEPLIDLGEYVTLETGLVGIADSALQSVAGRQALVVARMADDRSFHWAHASRSRLTNGVSPPDSLSKLLLLIDAIASEPVGPGGFEKTAPDVRFSVVDGVLRLTDLQVELLKKQRDEFRERFGRDPGPTDPVFWKRSADEPEAMTPEELAKEVAKGEELGISEIGKQLAAREVLFEDQMEGASEDDEEEKQSPYVEVNPLPLILVLSNAASMEGDLDARCLVAAVHCWMEGHLAAEGHGEAAETDAEMPAPPFPDPEADGDRLNAIVLDAVARFGYKGNGIDAIAYASAIAWRAGLEAGEACGGCAIGESSGAISRAMRRGEMRIEFFPAPRMASSGQPAAE